MTKYSTLIAAVSAITLLSACGGGKKQADTNDTGSTEIIEASAPDIPLVEAADTTIDAPMGDPDIPPDAVENIEMPIDVGAATPAGTDPDKIMIVMDGSGSMWGQIDGKSKMSIARGALGELVNDLPPDTLTGLMAYGHRRKGDCSDIELLHQPAGRSATSIISVVNNITPTGKTPLSAAVQQAAEALKYQESRATVILITDGIETCDIDPCALGESLEESGVDFTTHIVGFGLSEAEGRQIACLAEETGGQYIEASNAGELSDAMHEVAEAVEEEEPFTGTAEATLTVPDSVEIGDQFEVSWTVSGDQGDFDYIDLVAPDVTGTSAQYLSWFYTRDEAPRSLRAPTEPGTYRVRYIWVNPAGKEIIAEETIEVVEAAVAIFAPETVGIGQTFEVTWRGPGNTNDYIDMVPRGQTKTGDYITYAYTRNDVLELKAPGNPVELDLRYIATGSDGTRVMKSVPILVEDIRTELAFDPAANLGGILEVDWTGPGTHNDYLDIVERGFSKTNERKSYSYLRQGSPIELKLPAETGEYDVRYILSANDGKRILAVAPLTLGGVEVSLDFASEITVGETLEIDWVGPGGRSDYVDIVERGTTKTSGQLSYAYTRSGNPSELKLPGAAGAYDVRYVLQASDGKKVLLVKPLTITAADVSLDFAASVPLGKALEVAWTGPGGRSDFIDIVERGYRKTATYASYAYTRRGDILDIELPAKPGEYDLRYILQASDGKKVLLVKPLTVTDVDASLEAPAMADSGVEIEVSWEGPGTKRDFIDIVPRGKKLPKDSIHLAYTRKSNPVELRMPDEAGEYDIRYILQGANERVVKATQPITVK